MAGKTQITIKQVFKWLGRILLALLLLLALILIFLQTPIGKNFVRKQAVSYLQKKLNTKVAIGKLTVQWLSHLELSEVYVEDRSKHSLLSISNLGVDYDLSSIFSRSLTISEISIRGLNMELRREPPDSQFNYQFIADAFAGGPIDTTSAPEPFELNLGKLSLENILVEMNDPYGGQYFKADLPRLKAEFEAFDMQKMRIKIRHVFIDSPQLILTMTEPKGLLKQPNAPETGPAPAKAGLHLEIDTAAITMPSFAMANKPSAFDLKTTANMLSGGAISFNQANLKAVIGSFTLASNHTSVQYKSIPASKAVPQSSSDTVHSTPFSFALNRIAISNTNISIDDLAAKQKPPNQIDFGHLGITNLQVVASDIVSDGTAYSANIELISAVEKSGFNLKHLTGKGHYSDTGFAVAGLRMETMRNTLNGDIAVSYRSLSDIAKLPGSTMVRANINNTIIQLDDLLYVQPGLRQNESFRSLLGKRFYLTTVIAGPLSRLNIPSLMVKESKTMLLASGTISNLPDMDRLLIDLRLKQLSGNRKDLLALLPKGLVPDSVQHYIPQTFNLKGSYAGKLDDFKTDLQLNTPEGNIALKGTLKDITDSKNARYDMKVRTTNLQLGKLMLDTTLGALTANITIKGRGLDPATANNTFNTAIANAYYNGYTYQDVVVNGSLNNNTLDAQVLSNDPNANLDAKVRINMTPGHHSLQTETNLLKADLRALGFVTDTLAITGRLMADIPTFDSSELVGDILLSQLGINTGTKHVFIDSIQINARHANDSQYIKLTSPFAQATLNGHYSLQSIPAAIKTIANKYIYQNSADTLFKQSLNAQLNMLVHVPDSLLAVVDGLKKLQPFEFNGAINTDSSIIKMESILPGIVYNGISIDSISLTVGKQPNLTNDAINFALKAGRIESGSLKMENTTLDGTMINGTINAAMVLYDKNKEARYKLPFSFVNHPSNPFLHFDKSVLINKTAWKVNAQNIIYLNTASLKGTNLQLQNGQESIVIQSDTTTLSGLPLSFTMQQFRLKNLADFMNADSSLVDGFTNGILTIQSLTPFYFTSDLTIDSLRLNGNQTGTVSAKVGQQMADQLLVAISLLGRNNDVRIDGTYATNEGLADLQLNINRLDLAGAKPFVSEYLSKLNGSLKGNIKLTGTLDNPKLNGDLKTDSVETIYKDYATHLFLPDERILFDDNGIRFDDFIFSDSAGNRGELKGTILTADYRQYALDLQLITNNMLLIGKKMNASQSIYGPVFATANLNIKGNTDLIMMDGSIDVKDSSAFTLVYTSDGYIQQGDGLIEFFDPRIQYDSATGIVTTLKKPETTKFGIDLNLTVTDKSALTIVLDEITGDQLQVLGKADLNITMVPGAQMMLTGSYIVTNGIYNLSIAQVLKRDFAIQKGSSITWNGDPMKGVMDITALYKVKTSAGALVNDIQSVPGIDKQRLNFLVYLFLKNEMLKPDISFKLDMPKEDQKAFGDLVYTRIKQVNNIPSELSKQVMGLLTISQFIADNPFNSLSSNSSSLQVNALNTAGKIVTQQLTDFASSKVKGVDIDIALDVNEYYNSGEAQRTTDLKVGVTKSLANNRLKVYVGSNIAIESAQQNAESIDAFTGDITLEYLLTVDGKYTIKGFRIHENELTFDGTIAKTGVTFALAMEFNKIDQDMRKKKKKKR